MARTRNDERGWHGVTSECGWFVHGFSEGVDTPLPRPARSQDLLEMDRILRGDHLGGPWPMVVEQSRQPETQCGGAQRHRPGLALRLAEPALGPVGAEHRVGARWVERATVLIDAPVVDGHREIVEPGVDAGEIEVDHAAESRALGLEEDVVAEQVGVYRTAP